jgi:hypothetical protein
MADEQFSNPLDALAQAEEAAILGNVTVPPPMIGSDLAPDVRQPHVQETSTDAIPVESPPAEEPATPPVSEPAPATEPPPAEPQPTTAAPPTTEEGKHPTFQPSEAHRLAREQEKKTKEALRELNQERERIAALERERAELQAQLQQAQQPPDEFVQPEVDPVVNLQSQIQNLQAQIESQRMEQAVAAEARAFAANGHPDYEQAYAYLIESEKRKAEKTGEIEIVAERVRVNRPDLVRDAAARQGITEADASRQLAVGVLFEARRQTVIAGARAMNRPVPEVVWDWAQENGFRPAGANGNGNQPAPAPQVPPASMSAAEQLRTEQREATGSALAALPTGSSAPPKAIRSRADLMALPPAEQSAYIDNMDARVMLPPNDPRWVPQNWHELLSD